MRAKDWDILKVGDRIIAFNGPYHQDGVVTRKDIDAKGMRWVYYRWIAPNRATKFGCKRYVSIYFPLATPTGQEK